MRDADEDGFGDLDVKNCVRLEMFDGYGDSWSGAMINVSNADGEVLSSHTLTSAMIGQMRMFVVWTVVARVLRSASQLNFVQFEQKN